MQPQEQTLHVARWFFGFRDFVTTKHNDEGLKEIFLKQVSSNNIQQFLQEFDAVERMSFWTPDLHQSMIRAIHVYLSEEHKIPKSPWVEHPQVKSLIADFKEKGWMELPQLAPEKIKAMRAYFESKKPAEGNGNVGEFDVETVVECPHLIEIATDPGLLSLLEGYLGATPTAVIATAWWSYAGRSVAKDAQIFHRDGADIKFCNFFIYLTDVDMESGPHVYIERTHTGESIRQLLQERGSDNPQAFIDWYWNQLRKTDAEVEKYVGRDPKYFTGPAGTNFFADTRGFHKGLVPVKHDRLLAQFTFALTPKFQVAPKPRPLQGGAGGTFPEYLQASPLNYIFRLLVQTGYENNFHSGAGIIGPDMGALKPTSLPY